MSTKIRHPFVSFSLVFLQFALITVLLLVLPLQSSNPTYIIQASGILLGLWAVKTMHLGHFNIIPDPMPDIELVTTGPYRWIRHPMYASILLFFLPMIVEHFSALSAALYLILAATLLIKLSYEEHLLTEKLPDYPLYQSRTSRLLPKIY
ncbi:MULTISPECIES: methyltransferase family protein [Thiomicrorhabdus]|uniref:Isoprenylcysteine carboxylmethyltransferase family protein n=1 Tax=Thiomicrorhabdus heinhorstiae TaxID=2748010 RepID=A0ABS0BY50_9GAMM|nr:MULTISPECIES: isoprenylcysteine carboxylmethyltransferase family protein [Thiomicrorhabdus]MBF6058717.1 isoprenylcysteine carboxylmethyltransferase family protein [Thiomicrorhabdus heinhorstiae]